MGGNANMAQIWPLHGDQKEADGLPGMTEADILEMTARAQKQFNMLGKNKN
jgi:hypothetical protein